MTPFCYFFCTIHHIINNANKLENIPGIETSECEVSDKIKVNTVRIIDEQGEQAIGKPIGNYITIDVKNLKLATDEDIQKTAETLTNELVEEIVDKYAESAPEYKEDIAKIYDHKDEFVVLYEYTIPWIRDLKERGYKVYILSNWSEPVYEANKNTHLRFLKEVDGEIMSYRERMIKPDREIYELLCNRFNINPSEAVFLDDNAANVKGAKEFGLHAIHFKNYEQAKEELERYLAE